MACKVPEWGEPACGRADCYVRECDEPYADCNLEFDDGCETDLSEDPGNCGKCGVECEGADATCLSGRCL
jgi:hypothetical protein